MGVAGQEAVVWETLANSFPITGDTLSVRLWMYDSAVSADAIRIDRLNPDGTFTRIVDDSTGGDPNFREFDASNVSNGFVPSNNTSELRYGPGATSVRSSTAVPPGPRSATWVFKDLLPGTYRVSASWIWGPWSDPTATYELFSGLPGEGTPTTVWKDQKVRPADDFRSHRTEFQYDAAGNLMSAETEGLPPGTAVYDHFGKAVLNTDTTGVKSFAANDVLGRTVRSGLSDPDGTGSFTELPTTFAYDGMGRLRSSTDALGRISTSRYDLKGRLVEQTFADGASVQYGYDDKGNRTSITDELGRITRFTYDSRDRLIQTIHPDGAVERIQYDGAGNVAATIDALGRKTEFTYDKAGRLLSTKSAVDTADQIETVNKYDTLGRLVETVDANGIITQYKRDALGRVTQTTVLDRDHTPQFTVAQIYVSTTEYDANGRAVKNVVFDPTQFASGDYATLFNDPTSLVTQANIDAGKVRVTETKFDAFDRPTSMIYADGATSSTIYDAAGRVRYQFDELGRRTESIYDYNAYGRLTQSVAPDPDGIVTDQSSPITEFQYDAVGNVVAVIDPRGFTTSREYDSRHRIVAETDGVGAVRKSIYDIAGQMVASVDPRGFAASTRYDDRGRVVLERLVDPDGTGVALAPTSRHTYDAVGNVLYTTDPQGETTSFEYDSLNRLGTESRYETHIADDANGGNASFSASADATTDAASTAYGRDWTFLSSGATGRQFTWTFNSLAAGQYRVSLSHANVDLLASGLGAAATVQVVGAGVSVPLSQLDAPADLYTVHGERAIGWHSLKDAAGQAYPINVAEGGSLSVQLIANDTSGFLIADAVRIDRLVSRSFQYDKNGNLIEETDTRGFATTHNYDELSRLDQTVSADPDGTVTTLASLITDRKYDGFGNLVSEVHGHVTSTSPPQYADRRTDTFEYDKRNRLTKETINSTGPPTEQLVTAYEYDNVGNTVRVIDPVGAETLYRYDNLDRLIDEYQNTGEDRPLQPILITPSTDGLYYADGQINSSAFVISPDQKSITLSGNAWKAISINTFVSQNTILEFEFESDQLAEVHMIGFDSNNSHVSQDHGHFFELAGDDTPGSLYRKEFRREVLPNGKVKFHIPIGQYLTDEEKISLLAVNRLVLVNYETRELAPVDQGKSTFSDIRLYESDEVRTVTTYEAAGNVETVRTASDPRNITTRYEYDAVGRPTREILDAGGPMERKYTTVYDAAGNIVAEESPSGTIGSSSTVKTVHEYDPLNRLVKTTLPDPDSNPATHDDLVTKFKYDVVGNVIREVNGVVVINPLLFDDMEVTYTDYDPQGRPIAQTDGNGDETHYRYDSEGNLASVTDAEENVTSYAYDGLNRVKTETNAFGARTNTYNVVGNLDSVTDRNGRIRKFSYDTLDRRTLEEWKTAANPTITHALSWQYDDLGRVIKQVDSNNAVLGDAGDLIDTFAYDGLGRLTEETNYDPATTSGSSGRPEIRQAYVYFHNWFGSTLGFQNAVYRTQHSRGPDENIASTLWTYDRLGQLAASQDAGLDGSVTLIDDKSLSFTYDAAGNFDGLSRYSGFWADPADLVGSSAFTHDKANRPTLIDHQTGQRIRHVYDYDNASRITHTHTILSDDIISETHSYSYDDAGQLTEATGSIAESYAYDDNGNRIAVEVVTGPGNRLAQDDTYYYSYDAEGNLTRRTNRATGEVTIYAWDHRNRLTGVDTISPVPALNFSAAGVSSYTGQDGTGGVAGVLTVEESGKTVHLSGNAWKRIGFSTNLGMASTTYTVTANTVLSFDFYSPKLPEIAAIGLDGPDYPNGFNGIGHPTDPTRHFQLAGAETTGTFAGISPGVTYNGGWQHYEIRLADFAGAYDVGDVLNRFTFINDNDAGHVGKESFFRNIRLTEGPPLGTVLASTSYVYDAEGRRVQRAHDLDGAGPVAAASEYFVYDGSQLAMTFNDSKELAHRYLHGPQGDQVLVDEVFAAGAGGQRVSDEVLWLLADHQGSIRDVVDDTGALRNHVEYDSFGNITQEGVPQPAGSGASANAVDQLFYYHGQERDKNTGLQQHGERWYDAQMGRFISQDPIFADANLYRYAHNNPVLYVDPSGLYTQLPTSYLPAFSGSLTGFNQGTFSPTALDLGYSNFSAAPSAPARVSRSAVNQAQVNAFAAQYTQYSAQVDNIRTQLAATKQSLAGRSWYEVFDKSSDRARIADLNEQFVQYVGLRNVADDNVRNARLGDPLHEYASTQYASVSGAFGSGLQTGGKAIGNATGSSLSLGFYEGPFTVTQQDIDNGYYTSRAIAGVSTEIFVGVATGGASRYGRVGKAALAFDATSNVVGAGRGAVDAYNNGLSFGNATQIAAAGLGFGGNLSTGSRAFGELASDASRLRASFDTATVSSGGLGGVRVRLQNSPSELRISASQYPELAENIRHAQAAGHPSILTHGGDAVANRNAALRGVPQVRNLTRDEYPFASTIQGGAGAWVGHIPRTQQSAQGALIKNFIQQHGIQPGDQYRVIIGQ
ncbi:MAG: NucA/NucB deoxyribonuclease domain-containing protein [Planctomycetes bacterium]|nr:NucA/NucB deoxyribonuclease domain-containing protein [Planctomycetota bacterium]